MLFLRAALLLILFSCFTVAKADTIQLTVWHAYRDVERAALEKALTIIDNENDAIEITALPIPNDGYTNKLESATPRGNGPDVFIAAHERIGKWAKSKLIQDIESAGPGLSQVAVDAMTYDEKLYGVPLSSKRLVLFYNPELVETPPKTTDELLSISKELKAKGLLPLAYEATSAFHQAPWMHGYGGGLFNSSGEGELNSPQNVEGLTFLASLQAEKFIPEEPTSAIVAQLFNNGEAAMVINGPWFIGDIDSKTPYKIASLPMVSATGLPAASYMTVEGAFVSAYSKHKEEALALAKALASERFALIRATEGEQTVSHSELAKHPDIANHPIRSAMMANLNTAKPTPNRPEMSLTWGPMAKAIRRVSRGAMSPQEALDKAQIEFQVLNRPPPKGKNPWPALILMGLLLGGGLFWLIRAIKRNRKDIISSWRAYLYVAPAAFAMVLLTALPFVVGAGVSFFVHHDNEFTYVGLENFISILSGQDWGLWSSMSFYTTLAVTVAWTVLNVLLHVSIGVGMAMLLREPWIKMRGIYRVLLIIPWAIPNYITALIWKTMFNKQYGAVNELLNLFGIESVSWFSQFSTAFCANLITNTWLGFPFMMVVALGALQSIPRDLEYAAEVDGASGWQRFRYITLPMLKPAMLPAIILGSVWTFNMFNIIYLVSGGEPDSGTDILISDAYKWAFERGSRYGYAAAYAVLIFGILVLWSKLGTKIATRSKA